MARNPHHAKSRAIYPGQKIHASVAFKNPRYHPKAIFYPTPGALKRPDVQAEVPILSWNQLVAEGPSGNFHDDWKPRLEMDLFDLTAPSRAFPLLLGDLSYINTLQVLNRLGFLAALSGANAILSKDPHKESGDDQDDDKKDNAKSRRLTLKRLLKREDLVFLATVKLLARLATAPVLEADRLEMENILLSYSSCAESSSQSGLTPTAETRVADRIVGCLALEEPILGEAINTIIEIAPIGKLWKQLENLGVVEKLVRMLSAGKVVTWLPTENLVPILSANTAAVATSSANALAFLATSSVDALVALATPSANVAPATPSDAQVALATSSANALVALARYDSTWQTILELVRNNRPNFNSRLLAPVAGSDDTRDAAAIIIPDLVDYLVKSQITEKAPSGMISHQLDGVIDKETITLLNAMLVNEKRSDASAADVLAKQKLSDSAADALAKLSRHGQSR
ncbi:hypothetical protein FIBSPDRAFT_194422 [Athelia psychrophila]|uniref:Uncharacterized protein n=1 Tax=Athelia psychrophila TaxID=1759441 RepID=A0A166SL85_9AGAM|nr:hypothetical protein FIBSPDRAFT_194422 [Fibularhizoctonia sp. CBS 109695]